MINNEVPPEIIDHAKFLANLGGYSACYSDEDLEMARDRAVESIKHYKILRKAAKDRAAVKQRISEWLKSVTE